jgi:hypothetical protein
MHDMRAFRDVAADKWWVAQVLTAGGFGMGPGPAPLTEEGIFFTEIGDFESPSRYARLPAGRLNRSSHSSILKVLAGAKIEDMNVPLRPVNIPSAEEFIHPPITDDEGLKWVYRERSIPLFQPAGELRMETSVEFFCLEDTALTGVVRLPDHLTFVEFLKSAGPHGISGLVTAVKSSFPDVRALAP